LRATPTKRSQNPLFPASANRPPCAPALHCSHCATAAAISAIMLTAATCRHDVSRAASSAPWGLACWWCLAVAPIQLGGGGTRTHETRTSTAGCPGRKCPEYEVPRQPVTSGASLRHARGARQKSSPPPPHPRASCINPLTGLLLRAAPRAPGLASRKLIYSDPDFINPSARCGRADTCKQTA
jgi:hypothetical protein